MSDAPPAAETVTPPAGGEAAASELGNLLATAQAAPEAPPPETPAATIEEPAAKPEGAPESYADFTLPEGVALKDETLAEFREFAKAKNLTQDAAQEFLKFGADKLKEAAAAPYKLWEATQKTWQAEIAKDPEVGGAWGTKQAPGEAQVAATKAIDRFGGDALRTAMNVTGAGNHPAIVRAFVQMGKLLTEPGFVTGGVAKAPKTMAEVMYPTKP